MTHKPTQTHKRLSLDLTHQEHQKIKSLAELENRSKKNLCEILIRNYINENTK
jgi:hypothetical protein